MGIGAASKTPTIGHNHDMLRLLALITTCCLGAQQPLRLPREHQDYGLPHASAAWRPYSQREDHVCNAIWRAMYLTECAPTQVGRALPREHDDPAQLFVKGWYFAKRDGDANDRRLFGGDGRQMPVEGFGDAEARALLKLLRQIDGAALHDLKRRRKAAVWFQHDLLRLARRLLDAGQNAALLQPLLACARRVALPRDVLQSGAIRTASREAIAAQLADFDLPNSVEVQRRSSRLFDAEYVQLWSSIYLTIPGRSRAATAAWLTADTGRPPLALRSKALLIQGIVAMDDDGAPCATEMVIEARTQRLSNRDPLASDNHTTTRDGVDFAMWSLPRSAVRDHGADSAETPCADFRRIDMESQDLFRDYGTRKHTTYAAQCTLCHRRSHSPDEAIAGFSALRTSSKPRPAAAGERKAQAEDEMLRFLDKLRSK